MFNADFVDLGVEMSKEQEGGLLIDRLNIWMISDAVDVVLVASNRQGLKEMIKKLERYLRRK